MRHAKSDRNDPTAVDFDRPLNDRGFGQPKAIADQLNDLGIAVEKAVVSPAERTTETWNLLAKRLKDPPKPIFEKQLYNAYYQDFIDVLSKHAKKCHRLLAIGHCPSVIEVTEFLTGEYHDFKTANLAILSAHDDDLEKCLEKPGQFRFEKMIYPES